MIYLALKCHRNTHQGVIANTNLGGDNAYRGAVLGTLLGANDRMEVFPERWISRLLYPPPELKAFES